MDTVRAMNHTDKIILPPKPEPPSCSWWIGKQGSAFSAAAKAEQARMTTSLIGKQPGRIVRLDVESTK